MNTPPPFQNKAAHKASLRSWAKSTRVNLPIETLSQSIQQHILSSNLFQSATNIAIFYPLPHELSLIGLKQAYPDKQYFLPRVTDPETGSLWEEMKFYPYLSDETLSTGKMGLKEPPISAENNPCNLKLDLIIVPGLAFDKLGHRLGYGKGYYDRYLSQQAQSGSSCKSLGVIPSALLLSELPSEENDRAVAYMVTELGLIKVQD